KSQSLAEGLTSKFRGIVGGTEENAKARREGPRNQTGRNQPTGTGRPHKRARRTQAGSRFRDAKAGHFRIDFKPCADGAIGEVEIDGRVIWLADNHVTVQTAKNENDERSLLVLAVTLFGSYETYSEAPLLSMVRDGSVSRRIEMI